MDLSKLIEVKSAELHTPQFLGGKNLGQHLGRDERHPSSGVIDTTVMFFDEEKGKMIVYYNGEYCYQERTNVSCWKPKSQDSDIIALCQAALNERKKSPVPAIHATHIPKKITPQVSTPQDHVFAGPGAGKTGKS